MSTAFRSNIDVSYWRTRFARSPFGVWIHNGTAPGHTRVPADARFVKIRISRTFERRACSLLVFFNRRLKTFDFQVEL